MGIINRILNKINKKRSLKIIHNRVEKAPGLRGRIKVTRKDEANILRYPINNDDQAIKPYRYNTNKYIDGESR